MRWVPISDTAIASSLSPAGAAVLRTAIVTRTQLVVAFGGDHQFGVHRAPRADQPAAVHVLDVGAGADLDRKCLRQF